MSEAVMPMRSTPPRPWAAMVGCHSRQLTNMNTLKLNNIFGWG
jgi:hypothetical protein